MKKYIDDGAMKLMAVFLFAASFNLVGHAAELSVSDGVAGDHFGDSSAIDGNVAVVGAFRVDSEQGAAYLFRNFEDLSTATEVLKLTASDGAADDWLGFANSINVDNNIALVGSTRKSAVYLYGNLPGRTQSTEDIILKGSDTTVIDRFGASVSMDNNMAVIGAYNKQVGKIELAGQVYLYRGLSGRTQSAEDLILTSSDLAFSDYFGQSVAMSGNTAIVGANGKNSNQGAAYIYRNLDVRTQSTEDLILKASDGAQNDDFGASVAIEGNTAIVGAHNKNVGEKAFAGAAYLYRNLDVRTESTEDLVLTASDTSASNQFGYKTAIGNNAALISATKANQSHTGAVYLYLDLDTRTQSTEDLKITESNSAQGNNFGGSLSMSGDDFVIGAYGNDAYTGKAYTGSVSSLTTLDAGNTVKRITGISFESNLDWVVGKNSSGNQVILGAGDSASLLDSSKAVYIGKNSGSNSNILTIAGSINAEGVYIGSIDRNRGNMLQFEDTADYSSLDAIYLTEGNYLAFEWLWDSELQLFDFLDDTDLYVFDTINGSWLKMTVDNYAEWLLITDTARDGMLVQIFRPIPEPAGIAAFIGAVALLCVFRSRRKNA